MTFSLHSGRVHDPSEGLELLMRLGHSRPGANLSMDRLYEGNETRLPALDVRYVPMLPPLDRRVDP